MTPTYHPITGVGLRELVVYIIDAPRFGLARGLTVRRYF